MMYSLHAYKMLTCSILGQYLVEEILRRKDLELSFVWNRTLEVLRGKVEDHYILESLSSFAERYT